MPAFGIYSTTDEWLLLRGFTGSGWQRAKVRTIQPVQQMGQRQPSVFHPQFFSRGLFTTNPLALRGAVRLVSNAAPSLWRPESLAALWRRIKDAALSLKLLVSVWFWFLTVEYCKETWWVTVSLWRPGTLLYRLLLSSARAGCSDHVWAFMTLTSDDPSCLRLLLISCSFSHVLETQNHPAHFLNSVHCLWIKSTLHMSQST